MPPKLNQKNLRNIEIPVPPLEVQEEIVRILDCFTELTTNLNKELEKELTARKTQYEYYRDELLKNNSEVEMVKLRECCKNISSGGTPKATNKDYYGGDIPWLRTQEVLFNEITVVKNTITEEGLANSSAKWIPKNCVIVAISGATAGRSAINKIPLTTNQHCCNLEFDGSKIYYRYGFYWLSSQYLKLKSLGRGARGDLNSAIISDFEIPLLPLTQQERIVKILDNFESLINDISIGLPAEIEARTKQYEYYRDRILSFNKI